jgi:RNA polymerase sigma-70 factor (ECF subfamily)
MNLISGSTTIPARVERFKSEVLVAQSSAEGAFVDENERRRMARLDDAGLLGLFASGNFPAFDELVTRYREKVLRLVTSVLGSSSDAEDIAQDIFIKIYLSLDRFRGDASFSTYLYTVTVNRCRDELRKSKIRRFFSFDDWFSRQADHPSGDNGQQLDCDERHRAVRQAMKRLPSETQMLLYLREIEEMSYKELADIFDVEIGTIKSRLARSRDRLRAELLPYIREGTLPGTEAAQGNGAPPAR